MFFVVAITSVSFVEAQAPADSPAKDRPVVKIWPAGPPGGLGAVSEAQAAELRKQNVPDRVFHVDDPTLTLYLVDGGDPRPAVVICPGGGYNVLAWAKEGGEVAEWLNSLGVSGAVLTYRVPRRDPDNPHAAPLQDAQRAMRVMRGNAEKWNLDTNRIGMLGFSAGGNLTVMAGLHPNERTYEPMDDLDRLNCRPNFLIPIYPAYLGSADDPHRLNELVKVDKQSPPMFLAVTQDDKDRGIHCALLFAELTKVGVKAELHVYSKGGHGYGLRPSDNPVSTWPARCGDWLRVSGLLPKE
ncbi:MAG: alpha/beta hydrolase [Planctomycetales bacterium]|nr:alpha/beta hydrolase [Planctomycetales bacterium]